MNRRMLGMVFAVMMMSVALWGSELSEIKDVLDKIESVDMKLEVNENGKKLVEKYSKEAFFKAFEKGDWDVAFIKGFEYLKKNPNEPVVTWLVRECADLSHNLHVLRLFPLLINANVVNENTKDINDFCNAYIAKNNRKAIAYYLKGMSGYYDKLSIREIQHYFKKALELNPRQGDFAAFLGYYYVTDTKDREGAKKLYKYALKYAPLSYQANYNLLLLKFSDKKKKADEDEIIKEAWRLIEMSPASGHAQDILLYVLGKTGLSMDQGGMSKTYCLKNEADFFKTLDQYAEKNIFVYMSFGKVFANFKHYGYFGERYAIKCYKRALKQTEDKKLKAKIYTMMLDIISRSEQNGKTKKIEDEALKYDNPDVYFFLASILFYEKQFDKAIKYMKKSLEYEGDMIETYKKYSYLGSYLSQKEMNAEGIQYLLKALSIRKDDLSTLYNLSYVYQKIDQPKKALVHLKSIVHFYPKIRMIKKIKANIEYIESKIK